MYYLKYRPNVLDELDSDSVKKTLQSILTSGSIPHAFLFSGPKGTGKTSTARIVAKILNCEENAKAGKISTLNPSLKDKNVQAIAKGISPDVIEMDAASNRKIDDIRDLISNLKFSPIVSRYKIYIVDEVHMLTKEAFNALLKSLEEPPPLTIFILATTEPEKMPKTIRSRCVDVHFRKAHKDDILRMLNRIVKGEKLKIDSEALSFLADHSDGSFRDAAKLLELAVFEKALTLEKIKIIAGEILSTSELLTLVIKKDLPKSLDWTENAYQHGADFKVILESLLQKLHQQLLKKNGIEVPDKEQYNISIKDISRLIALFQSAYRQMRYSPIESLPLQIAIVDFIENCVHIKEVNE